MGLGWVLLGPWLGQGVPGRRGLSGRVSRQCLGLTRRLGLGLLLSTGLGLMAWLRGRMPRFRRGLSHRFGLLFGKS